MKNPTTQDSTTPADRVAASRSAVSFASQSQAAKAAAERDARAQLEVATLALQDNGTPDTRRAVLEAEQNLSLAMLEATGAANRVERAHVALKEAEQDEQSSARLARLAAVTPAVFSQAVAPHVAKLAKARQTVAEHEAEVARLVRGFSKEAADVGAPRVDYVRLAESLTARAGNKPVAAILTEVWGSAPVPGLSAEDSLRAAESGVTDLQHRINALRAAEASAGACARALVDRCHFPTSRSAARDTTVVGQCESTLADARAIRASIEALGIKAAADAVKVDPLAAALEAAGPAVVASSITLLRGAEFLAFDAAIDGATKNPAASHEARKQAQAEAAWNKLEALSPEIAKAVGGKPKAAQPTAVTTKPVTFGGFDVDVRA